MEQRKYISTKAIIGSIIRDFGINSFTFNNDIIEWIGDAIDLIQTQIYGYEIKYEKVVISDFKIPIPHDAITVYNIFHNGYPLIKGFKNYAYCDTNITGFDYLQTDLVQTINANSKLCETITDCCSIKKSLIDEILSRTDSLRKDFLFYSRPSTDKTYNYQITPHCIKTTLDEGDIIIQYLSFATDTDGFPLVVDLPLFKEFVKYYCMSKLIQRGVKHPTLNFETIYQLQKEYKIKATNESKTLTDIDLDNFTSKWSSLIGLIDFNKPSYQN